MSVSSYKLTNGTEKQTEIFHAGFAIVNWYLNCIPVHPHHIQSYESLLLAIINAKLYK